MTQIKIKINELGKSHKCDLYDSLTSLRPFTHVG